MKNFFQKRAPREKYLLLVFAALGGVIWLTDITGRWRSFSINFRNVSRIHADQVAWLNQRAAVEARANAAIRNLDRSLTFSPTRLAAEVTQLAEQAQLSNVQTASPRTEGTREFSFHSLRMTVSRSSMEALIRFYQELNERSPYILLEEFSAMRDRQDANLLQATFRISSVELR